MSLATARSSEEFAELITSIVARFARDESAAEIDRHIETSLQEIAEFTGVDYAYVVRTSSDLASWSVAYEWCSPEAPSLLAAYQDVPMGAWWYAERVLLAGEVFLLNNTEEIPSEAADVRKLIESVGFKSSLQIPTRRRGGQIGGCIALSSLTHEVAWTAEDIARLRLVGETIANVTELRRSETELRLAHDELEQRRALTVAASLDGVWEWDAKSERVQYSDRFLELLGYKASEVPQTLEFFRGVLYPEDAASVWGVLNQHLEQGDPCDVSCRLRGNDGEYRWFRMRGQTQRDDEGRPTWMAGSIQDVHREKTAETELREALKQVERLTERLRAENVYLQQEITHSMGFDEIVGQSQPLRSVLAQVEHVAGTDASVLLLGETGTGKEILARAIHDRSNRRERPLVKVNLAALPSSLIESELFGHKKGSFTGAIGDKIGRFQLADGGTLFLDEIGELDPELQTKLLRVLQEGEFEPIGSTVTRMVDVRIVAATNRDLRRAMEQGDFRPDLYYRLAVFPIDVPPLRLRPDDIPLLVWHFVSKKQGRLGKSICHIPDSVMKALIEYDWPGNVRELENVIERSMILTTGTSLTLAESLHSASDRAGANRAGIVRLSSRTEADRDTILVTLKACRWKVKGSGNAADRLGLKPSTLRYRMKVLGIQRPQPGGN